MDSSQTPFDEDAALEELERLRDAIQAARRARMAKSDEFDQFVNGFKNPSPPVAAPELDPEPQAEALPPAIDLPVASPIPELLTLTPAPEPAAQMFERLTRMLEPPAQPPERRHQTSPLPSPTPTVSEINAVEEPLSRVSQPRRYPANRLIGTVAVATVALIPVLMYWSRGPSTRVAEAPAPAVQSASAPAAPQTTSAPPTPAPQPVAPPAPVAAVKVELRTLQPVWMRVAVDGQKQREGTVPAGERLQLHGDHAIVIRAGNGGDVMVKTANGETPLGVAGQPVTFTFTKAGGKS